MKVLVNGLGNIGTTIINLLNDYRKEFGITKLYARKNILNKWEEEDLKRLENKGIIICYDLINESKFVVFENKVSYEKIKDEIDYIFETTTNDIGIKNREEYKKMNNLMGVSAQGSEKGFGIPYMYNVNDEQISGEKFAQVVSCNTHGTLSLLKTFCNDNLSDLDYADFVVVRRSEDINNHERMISSNVIARHLDDDIGTHHAIDALELLKTVNLRPKITSSDITTPSQLLHSVRFNLKYKDKINIDMINKKIDKNSMVSLTTKFGSNKIFEQGRRYGKYGRLYSHIIIVNNNILLEEKNIKGWVFVPQEGNSIVSSLSAMLEQMKLENRKNIMDKIVSDLVMKKI